MQHLVTRNAYIKAYGNPVSHSNASMMTSNWYCITLVKGRLGRRKAGISVLPDIGGMRGQWSQAMAYVNTSASSRPAMRTHRHTHTLHRTSKSRAKRHLPTGTVAAPPLSRLAAPGPAAEPHGRALSVARLEPDAGQSTIHPVQQYARNGERRGKGGLAEQLTTQNAKAPIALHQIFREMRTGSGRLSSKELPRDTGQNSHQCMN